MVTKSEKNNNEGEQQARMEDMIQRACNLNLGVLQTSFLCRSVSVLEPRDPVCVPPTRLVRDVVADLQANRVGCVVITDVQGRVSGIFSERDLVLKIMDNYTEKSSRPVADFMTSSPITQPPDATLAFVLNLMSSGGFRHLPIVDSAGAPIGIISVKDVIDFIVQSFTQDLLSFEVA